MHVHPSRSSRLSPFYSWGEGGAVWRAARTDPGKEESGGEGEGLSGEWQGHDQWGIQVRRSQGGGGGGGLSGEWQGHDQWGIQVYVI